MRSKVIKEIMTYSKLSRTVSPQVARVRHFTSRVPEFTRDLEIVDPASRASLPIYKVMNETGRLLGDESYFSQVDTDTKVRLYEVMVALNEMDKVMYESQRQGRISFYMTSFGEEGSHVGSAAALHPEDLVYAQYRETGVYMWRNPDISDIMDQLYGNIDSGDKGKQMPVHYGSRAHHLVTISSPLGTQLPQAVGSAYGFKLRRNGRVVAVYFGEGAASEGDAFTAFNFAATLECPLIFFCRNNGYAISTPASEQYGGDGVASRGLGLGISAIRVDGNDVCAVYNATKEARDYVLKNNKAIIIEAMTYRVGHHSTSDDSTAYRSNVEVKEHEINSPIQRYRAYLMEKNLWSEEKDKQLRKERKQQVLSAIKKSESKLKPNWKEMFQDVYSEMPQHIKDQMKEVQDHLKIYKEHYPLQNHA